VESLRYLAARDMLAMLDQGVISARELTQGVLQLGRAAQHKLNAFVSFDEEGALASASAADNARAMGQRVGVLAGVPTSVKDLIDVRGQVTSFGSQVMADNVRDQDAPSVARLRSAGAVIIGKTTTTEFGCKAGGGDSPLTGTTRNPWDTLRTTGGSSAGAAASVAAGITPFAIGTDGGGSVRIPASLCGIFGIKGHFGRVPVYPVSATPTLGHVGVLSRTVEDAALALETMSGFYAQDPFSLPLPVPNWRDSCGSDVRGLRVLWSPTLGYARPSDEVLSAAEAAVRSLEEMGAIVDERDRLMEDPIDLWMSEFYAGVGTKLKSVVVDTPDLLDPAVVEVLRDALHVQTLEQYYVNMFERLTFREHVRRVFDGYDILITPTLPVTAFEAGRNVPDGHSGRNMVSWVYYTYPFNLSGNPAASIPCGFDEGGMPIGIQVVAPMHREDSIFQVASAMEHILPWGGARPAA
jgi:Asp-tRNA(Asn)/Glu-tRNA(Gln) amidotransferase A subunit family amidase